LRPQACIIHIELLHDAEGRDVTRVDVSANGNRFAGEPEWWCADAGSPLEPEGIGIRVVQGIPKLVAPDPEDCDAGLDLY